MIVNDLYFLHSGWCPAKTDTILIIDPNAVLACSITHQRLKPVAGRHVQVIQAFSDLKLAQLAQRYPLDADKTSDPSARRQCCCVSIPE